MPGITLLGLGPGNPAQLTREAWEILSQADEIWLRTQQHPTVQELPTSIKVHSFDDLYDQKNDFEQVYMAIIEKVLELPLNEAEQTSFTASVDSIRSDLETLKGYQKS